MDALYIDVILSIYEFLDEHSIYTLACCSRRFRHVSRQAMEKRRERSRQQFIDCTKNELNVTEIARSAVKHNQFYFEDWHNFIIGDYIKHICSKRNIPLSSFVFHMIRLEWDAWGLPIGAPYSQDFHNFILYANRELTTERRTILFLCFRATTTEYTRAAYMCVKQICQDRVEEHKNTYRGWNDDSCKFDIVTSYRNQSPRLYYEMLPQLDLTARHWAALCVADVRRTDGNYFKTKQAVIDYYHPYITSLVARNWVKRKLQAYKLVFPW